MAPTGDEPGVPPPGHVAAAIAQTTLDSTRTLALSVGLLFAAFIVTDTLLFAHPVDRILAIYDAGLAAIYLGLHGLLWRGSIPARHAHAVAGCAFLLPLPYLLGVIVLTEQPLQTSGLALWQIGCGIFLLSRRWLIGLLAASGIAWAALVSRLPADPDWQHFGVLLLSSTVLALVAGLLRLRTATRLEALRLQESSQRRSLEAALIEARQVGEMRRANELKTRFMNVAAHELATPMTPLLIQTRMLRDMQDRLPPQAHKHVQILDRSLGRMNGLLRDILDGSRLQADQMVLELRPMDLQGVLAETVEAYRPMAAERGTSLRLEAPIGLKVTGDSYRLTQVVTNFLSNAIKFAPGGTVEVRASHDSTGHVRVEVRDDGLGFESDRADQLFQPFSQLHEPDANRKGSGLGLYICKGIVLGHAGTIGGESEGPGKGSRFWFTLPSHLVGN